MSEYQIVGKCQKQIGFSHLCILSLLALTLIAFSAGASLAQSDRLVIKDDTTNDVFKVTDEGWVFGEGRMALGVNWPLAVFHLGFFNSNVGIFHSETTSAWLWVSNAAATGDFNTCGIGSAGDNLRFRAGDATRITVRSDGNLGLGVTNPEHIIHATSGARLTAAGVWEEASSREFKTDIADLSSEDAFQALMKLNPVRFKYKTDPNDEKLGFIAEDVPDIVATSDRKGMNSMDVVAVLTQVLKEQQKSIAELNRKIEILEKK